MIPGVIKDTDRFNAVWPSAGRGDDLDIDDGLDDFGLDDSCSQDTNTCGGLADWDGFEEFIGCEDVSGTLEKSSAAEKHEGTDTRLIKYTSGLRVQWELEPGQDHIITDPTDPSASTPQIFITFGNHLGSTSAVVDYQTLKRH